MNRAGHGRPLRFVGTVGFGWIAIRMALTWPVPPPATGLWTAWPPPKSRVSPPFVAAIERKARIVRAAPVAYPWSGRGASILRLPASAPPNSTNPPPILQPTEGAGAISLPAREAPLPPPLIASAAKSGPRHWQGSAWLVLRPGQGIGAAPTAGQLGGSQFGARLVRTLDRQRRLAGFVRVAGPLRGRGAETALGLEWQPGAAPLRFAIEQRFGLDGMRGGPGAGAVIGLDRYLAGFRLEAFGQAGTILRSRIEPYADGALRLTRDIAARRRTTLRIGAGSWGAAQRGVRRLDVGPTLVAIVPIGTAPVRIALDWRQRIAGTARPGSGVALTLGSDF